MIELLWFVVWFAVMLVLLNGIYSLPDLEDLATVIVRPIVNASMDLYEFFYHF